MPRRKKPMDARSDVRPHSKRRSSRRSREPKPQWDDKTGILSYQGVTVLEVLRPHSFQWMVLAAFAQAGWRQHIADPLRETPAHCPERLTQTVKDLNRKQKNTVRLRFTIDTDRQSLCWSVVEQ